MSSEVDPSPLLSVTTIDSEPLCRCRQERNLTPYRLEVPDPFLRDLQCGSKCPRTVGPTGSQNKSRPPLGPLFRTDQVRSPNFEFLEKGCPV